MRLIKFRAWDKSRGKFSNTGNLFMDIPHGMLWWQFAYDITPINNDDGEFVLMQFTGLHDKNGKEIWEGDIIRQKLGPKIADVIGPVIFVDGCFRIEHGEDSFDMVDHSDMNEVLGSIYENKELLK